MERWSYAAGGNLDRHLEEYLTPRTGGVFVEAGAHDGVWRSNTYFLEKCRGWTGILVEPVPALAFACGRHRPRSQVFSCALGAPVRPAEQVTLHCADVMSFIEGAHGSLEADAAYLNQARAWLGVKPSSLRVPLRALSDVLDEAGAPPMIDFLSLDVEGAEAAVVRGLDFSRHLPRMMLVELMNEPALRRFRALIPSSYVLLGALSHHDYLFVTFEQGVVK